MDQQPRRLRLHPAPHQLAGLEEEGRVDRGGRRLGSSDQGLDSEERAGSEWEVVEATPLLQQS